MNFSLKTLGNSAVGPTPERWPSGHGLRTPAGGFLIDCGEGIQIALQRNGIGWGSVDRIFITHLHGDHVYGLPGLLTSWGLNQRDQPLTIYSPPGLRAMLEAVFRASHTGLPYAVEYLEIDPASAPQLIGETDSLQVSTLPMDHRVPTVGYLFRERPHPRTLRSEKIAEHGIPFQQIPDIKAGADFQKPDGQVIANAELTLAPPPPRALAYCGDTRFQPALAELVAEVDLLVHEATFLHEMVEQAQLTGHSTARQAAELAKAASVGRLVLTHFSPRYGDLQPLLNEARAVFPETYLAEEGRMFTIPYAGRAGTI